MSDSWPIAIGLGIVLIPFAAWFGWNLGLAAGGSRTTDAWRKVRLQDPWWEKQ